MRAHDTPNCAAPLALGLVCAGLTVLCLWMAHALLALPGATPLAFACASGALFWASGLAVAAIRWMDLREEERERKRASARSALRARFLGRPA